MNNRVKQEDLASVEEAVRAAIEKFGLQRFAKALTYACELAEKDSDPVETAVVDIRERPAPSPGTLANLTKIQNDVAFEVLTTTFNSVKEANINVNHFDLVPVAAEKVVREAIRRAVQVTAREVADPVWPYESELGSEARYLIPEDLSWLLRFKETTEDDQSYDVPKESMKRLAELGVVQSVGFGRYSMTAFGNFVAGISEGEKLMLPLGTYKDHMVAAEARMHERFQSHTGTMRAMK